MKTTIVQTLYRIDHEDERHFLHAAVQNNLLSLKPKNGNMFNFTHSKPEVVKAMGELILEASKLIKYDNRTKSPSSKKIGIRAPQARRKA